LVGGSLKKLVLFKFGSVSVEFFENFAVAKDTIVFISPGFLAR